MKSNLIMQGLLTFLVMCVLGFLYANLMLLMGIRQSPVLSTEFITFVVLELAAMITGWYVIGKVLRGEAH